MNYFKKPTQLYMNLDGHIVGGIGYQKVIIRGDTGEALDITDESIKDVQIMSWTDISHEIAEG